MQKLFASNVAFIFRQAEVLIIYVQCLLNAFNTCQRFTGGQLRNGIIERNEIFLFSSPVVSSLIY